MENRKLDIAKEIVRAMVVDAFNHGKDQNTKTGKSAGIRHCGTNFRFVNQNTVVVNDKKKNLRFTLTATKSSTSDQYGWNLEFHRNDERKVKKLLNSSRWKSAVDRISAAMSPEPTEAIVSQ